MKIVCDNCATKYSIADEKVRGKVFKIRCKKCSHIIVVRGGESGAPQEAAGSDAAFPGDDGATLAARGGGAPAPIGGGGAGEAVWHLVVDREQIGPLTPAEVRAKFAAGEVDVETYAWREGFADWLRLGSIEDFRDLGAAAPAPAQEEGATRRTDTADLFASSSASDDGGDGASDLFGGGGASAPAPAAQPMAAAPAESFSSGGGANLFGAPEEAPAPVASRPARTSSPGFSAPAAQSNGGGAQAGADASGRMTGQRNENSVLFSLNNLQALASGGGGAAAPKPGVDTRPGFANSQTEGSGLIDIRAMAASTLAASPATGGSSKSEDPVSFSAAPIFSPMAAPILMPAAPSGPPKWMWAILGVGVLAVIGIVTVGVLLLTRKPAEPLVAQNNLPAAGTTQGGTAQPAANGTAPTGAQPAATKPAAEAAKPTDEAGKPAAKVDDPGAHAKHGGAKAEKAPKVEKGTKVAKADSSPVAAPAATPAPEAAPKKKKGGDALDDLLNNASPDKPAAAPKKAAREESSGGGGDDSSLPDALTKSDIQSGMSKVRDRVNGCYGQYHVPGLASVQVTIGKNGRVSNANVTGTFAGTPTGGCLEKAVKTASFPPAKNGTTITYPYVLR